MAENVYFMDGVDFTEETYNAYMKKVMANDGYLVGEGSELEVIENTPAAMNVVVGTGKAWVQGVLYENTAAKTITVDAADATHPRIDRIVVRLTWADDTVEAVYLKGTAAASPAAPALTQSAAVWELSLAQILIPVGKTSIVTGDITDERNTTTCGQAACRLGSMHVEADGSLDAASHKITNLADPTSAQDAATQAYVGQSGFEIGDVKWSGRTSPATGWLLCNGAAISRSTYAALFTAIGTAFGVGDGSTTFNLPAGGKVPVGYLSGDADFGTLGKSGGEKTHLLTGAESGLPAHTHQQQFMSSNVAPYANDSAWNTGSTTAPKAPSPTSTLPNTAANATAAHNNLQPYQVLNMFIKYA